MRREWFQSDGSWGVLESGAGLISSVWCGDYWVGRSGFTLPRPSAPENRRYDYILYGHSGTHGHFPYQYSSTRVFFNPYFRALPFSRSGSAPVPGIRNSPLCDILSTPVSQALALQLHKLQAYTRVKPEHLSLNLVWAVRHA